MVACLPSASLAARAKPAGACAHTRHVPTAATIDKARRATACLINARRVARGLRPLRVVSALNRAAQRHSEDMVRRNYFSHSSRNGASPSQRLRWAGWRARGSSLFAENIAWGDGSFGDAQSIVAGWMRSRGHRANILHPGFRQLGVGVAPGVPKRRARGGTYTADFAAS